MTNDSLIDKMRAIKPSPDSPELSERAYAQAVEDCIDIIREHQQSQGDLTRYIHEARMAIDCPEHEMDYMGVMKCRRMLTRAIAVMGEHREGACSVVDERSRSLVENAGSSSPANSSEISVVDETALEAAWRRLKEFLFIQDAEAETRRITQNMMQVILRESVVAYEAAKPMKPVSGKQPIETAPKGIPVIVVGGIAVQKTGGEWFTGMEAPLYERALQWQPKWWMPIPAGEEYAD